MNLALIIAIILLIVIGLIILISIVLRSPQERTYRSQTKTLEARAIVQAPDPIKPLIDSTVFVSILLASSSYIPKKEEGYGEETIPLSLKKTPLITIKAVSNAFEVAPDERQVPVPISSESISKTDFLVKPKEHVTGGKHKILFEFYQLGLFLGKANFDLTVGSQEPCQIEVDLGVSLIIPV